VESVRFRSIPFKNPTSKLPEDDDKPAAGPTRRQQRELDRVSQWKEGKEPEDQPKNYLTPSEKKRVAFIKKELHDTAGSVNAYIVFAYPEGTVDEDDPASDPFKAVELAVAECDGATFMDRIIRVDFANRSSTQASGPSDPKLAIFIGNLDFEAQEEGLRTFFDNLIASELEDSGDARVKHVRIIRDSATQLGKGFAYVHLRVRSIKAYPLVCTYLIRYVYRTGTLLTHCLDWMPQS
jgi:nucleolar protein 12